MRVLVRISAYKITGRLRAALQALESTGNGGITWAVDKLEPGGGMRAQLLHQIQLSELIFLS